MRDSFACWLPHSTIKVTNNIKPIEFCHIRGLITRVIVQCHARDVAYIELYPNKNQFSLYGNWLKASLRLFDSAADYLNKHYKTNVICNALQNKMQDFDCDLLKPKKTYHFLTCKLTNSSFG